MNMKISSRNTLHIAMPRFKTSQRTRIIMSCCGTWLNTDQHGKTQSFLRIPSLQVCRYRGVKKIQSSLYSGIILNKSTVASSCCSNKKRTQPPEALEASFFNIHSQKTSFHLKKMVIHNTDRIQNIQRIGKQNDNDK